MSQFLRPNADTVLDGWLDDAGGGTDIYLAIDEATRDDLDFIYSPNNPDNTEIYEGALSSGSTPDTGTRTVRYAYRKSGSAGRTIEINVQLREGTTQIHLWTHSDVSDLWVPASQTVTGSITDYSNLNMRAWGVTTGGGAGRRAQVSWFEFEIPNAPAGAGTPYYYRQLLGYGAS